MYKGIVGTVSFAVSISTLLEKDEQQEDAAIPAAAGAPGCTDLPIVKEIKTMIDAAFTSCKPRKNMETARGATSIGSSFHEGSSMAFLMHELGYAVRSSKLLPSIREWLQELVTEDLEQTFVSDFVDENTQTQKMGSEPRTARE